MRIDIISAVPELMTSAFAHSILSRAIKNNLAEVNLINLRDYSVNKQKQIDSVIQAYNSKIGELDIKISNIKEKTTIIKEYYHEVSQAADKFTPNQVDSFFKSRYNY